MATIKQIEHRTVHQIQSGQVIVDAGSVVKELVENSIDAAATTIDIRFKNQGLDSIEVQDNGVGISPEDYETVALKHHTSKLSTYSDIATLQTFGFRGEALASLCALAKVSITTCRASDAPKGARLDFEVSGQLKSTCVVAAQKGTTIVVERLFHNLPVRRRELERNIKREWGKVIVLLNQYACILTGIKLSVSQQPSKGKRIVLFSTKGNSTTLDNVINLFGAKAVATLVDLDLRLELVPTVRSNVKYAVTGNSDDIKEIRLKGHVSRPAHGEGRQTPDRQMFFVNGRPCGLPQFARVFNEVYKSYNATQSPFILADVQLDTDLYDVNVSPDKRTILLHDQGQMLESLRQALAVSFDSHDYAVPASRLSTQRSLAQSSATTTPEAVKQCLSNETSSRYTPDECASDAPAVLDSETLSSTKLKDYEQDTDTESPTVTDDLRAVEGYSPAPSLAISQSTNKVPNVFSHMMNNVSEDRSGKPFARQSQVNVFPLRSTLLRKGSISRTETRDTSKFQTSSLGSDADLNSDSENARETISCAVEVSSDHCEQHFGAEEKSLEHRDDECVSPAKPWTRQRAGYSTRNQSTINTTVVIGSQSEVQNLVGGQHLTANHDKISHQAGYRITENEKNRQTVLPTFGSKLARLFSVQTGTPGGQTLDSIEGCPSDDGNVSSADTSEESNGSLATLTPESSSRRDSDYGERDVSGKAKDVATLVPFAPMQLSIEDTSGGNTVSRDDRGATKKDFASRKPRSRPRPLTTQFVQYINTTEDALRSGMVQWKAVLGSAVSHESSSSQAPSSMDAVDAEERLSLKISKSDFGRMRIVGQFNLGFILAVRPSGDSSMRSGVARQYEDELFIIDQHASDEKYNFERLQAATTVQSQRLVQGKTLQLTALEEEVVMNNIDALEANGFKVVVDEEPDLPVGSRCRLIALPLSRETTFTLADLQELIYLLSEGESEAGRVPRPAKVRKMFAMRACRSSVMIGKALSPPQMERIIRHMGELDKPWNCPHGRPTMRHLCGLNGWDDGGWKES